MDDLSNKPDEGEDFIPSSRIDDGPNPGDRIVFLLERLVEGQNGYPSMTESVQKVTNVSTPTTNRLRVTKIVLTGDINGDVSIKVGTAAYTFRMAATLPIVWFPFPIVIENGMDLVTKSTGAPVTAYLIYTSE